MLLGDFIRLYDFEYIIGKRGGGDELEIVISG